MRVVLIAPADERTRLRSRASGALDIVGEFETVAEARVAGVRCDAWLVSPERRDDAGPEPLTGRELEVLELLAQGLSNKGIAARLGISDQTVKFHVASLAGKLGARNRTDAVRRGVRRGLVAL